MASRGDAEAVAGQDGGVTTLVEDPGSLMPIEIAPTSLEVQWDTPESTRRHGVALRMRADALLDRARAFIEVPPCPADSDGVAAEPTAELLEFTVNEILARLAQECHALSAVECVRAAEIAVEAQRLRAEHQQWVMSQRLRAITSVQDLLGRGESDVGAALEAAAAEACRTLGFDRAMIFRLSNNLLIAEATHFVGQTEWARECHDHAVAHPIELRPEQLEAEMLRRRAAALVTDPMQDPNAWRPIVQKIRTPGYVAVPVVVRGEVVATLHADAQISGRRIGTAERDALAAYAIGLGYAIERAVLVDRLRSQREAMQRMVDSTDRTVEDFLRAGSRNEPAPGGDVDRFLERGSVLHGLSPREREVLHLMADGATNQEIAARLVISLATVKSHVKAVLRKTGATHRGQAISLYLQRQ